MSRTALFFFTFLIISKCFNTYANAIGTQDSILNNNRKDTAYVNMLNNKSRELYMSDPKKALEFAIKGKEISTLTGYKKGLANSLLSMGSAYYFQNDFQKALDNFSLAKNLYREIDDSKGLANCLNNIGLVFIDLNKYALAQEYFMNALLLYDSIGFNNGKITGYNNMARIYYQTGNPDKAIEYFNYALEVYASTEEPDINAYIMCYNNIAIILLEQKKYQSALDNLFKAKEIALNNNLKKQLSLIYINMSHVYLAQNETKSAINCLENMMQIADEFDDDIALINAHIQFANIYSKKRDFHQSVDYGKKAMKIATELGLIDMQMAAHNILYNTYKELGKYEDALKHLESYKALNDSVFSAQKNKQLLEVEAVYQIEKKEKENELLKKDNIIKDLDILRKEKQRNYLLVGIFLIISFAVAVLYFYTNKKKANTILQEQRNKLKYINGKLNEALALKDKFLSILSHDLRSPVIALGNSLKKLKNTDLQRNSDDFQKQIELFEKQYETTKELLENLLLWANAQSDKLPFNKEKLVLKKIIENCTSVYTEAAQLKDVELITSNSEILEVSADKFMLESIFRNLISNALKFSFKGGQINISIKEEAENILVTVSDTGIGMSEDELEKLFSAGQNFSKSGTSGEKGTGLGLLLCKEFVEKNGGTIWVESSKGKGSRFYFTLSK